MPAGLEKIALRPTPLPCAARPDAQPDTKHLYLRIRKRLLKPNNIRQGE